MKDDPILFKNQLDLVTADNVRQTFLLHQQSSTKKPNMCFCDIFALERAEETDASFVWLCHLPQTRLCHIGMIGEFAHLCAIQFDLKGIWHFSWSQESCEGHPQHYGGGAVKIRLESYELDFMTTDFWLSSSWKYA